MAHLAGPVFGVPPLVGSVLVGVAGLLLHDLGERARALPCLRGEVAGWGRAPVLLRRELQEPCAASTAVQRGRFCVGGGGPALHREARGA